MPTGQTPLPQAWLITDARLGDVLALARRLPRGTGVLVRQHELRPGERCRLLRGLRRIGRHRGLLIVDEAEGRRSARVHDAGELRQALLQGPKLIFLSPIHATQTHPDWSPLPRMRAAAIIRLSNRPVLALGGMSVQRYRRVAPLGFAGWGGIDGWLTGTRGPSRLSIQ